MHFVMQLVLLSLLATVYFAASSKVDKEVEKCVRSKVACVREVRHLKELGQMEVAQAQQKDPKSVNKVRDAIDTRRKKLAPCAQFDSKCKGANKMDVTLEMGKFITSLAKCDTYVRHLNTYYGLFSNKYTPVIYDASVVDYEQYKSMTLPRMQNEELVHEKCLNEHFK